MSGNFEFIKAQWPVIQADCAHAERQLTGDPRAACFYARRAVEQLVGYVYDVARLRPPYRDDLAARIAEPSFRNLVGVGIAQKLTLIRLLGNRAVHDKAPIPQRAALDALRELFHVVVWSAHRYSTDPAGVPTSRKFDPALARSAAPLGRDEVVRLAERFREQDEEHQRQLAERDDLTAAKDAEIERLRAEIAAVQAAQKPVDDHDYSEAETRDRFIDVLLAEAGWPLAEERDREYPVVGMPVSTGSTSGSGEGFVDYVLWGADGLPLAVVEASAPRRIRRSASSRRSCTPTASSR